VKMPPKYSVPKFYSNRARYARIPRPPRGMSIATGRGSALFGNRMRFLIRSGARRWLNRARTTIRRRNTARYNLRKYGFPMNRKY